MHAARMLREKREQSIHQKDNPSEIRHSVDIERLQAGIEKLNSDEQDGRVNLAYIVGSIAAFLGVIILLIGVLMSIPELLAIGIVMIILGLFLGFLFWYVTLKCNKSKQVAISASLLSNKGRVRSVSHTNLTDREESENKVTPTTVNVHPIDDDFQPLSKKKRLGNRNRRTKSTDSAKEDSQEQESLVDDEDDDHEKEKSSETLGEKLEINIANSSIANDTQSVPQVN